MMTRCSSVWDGRPSGSAQLLARLAPRHPPTARAVPLDRDLVARPPALRRYELVTLADVGALNGFATTAAPLSGKPSAAIRALRRLFREEETLGRKDRS